MKTLYLLRHAKAEDRAETGRDFDRALTSKGITQSMTMGKRLANISIQPDIIISSPAQRALQTAKIVKENMNHSTEIIQEETIYESTVTKLMDIIKNTNENIQSLMLVGHNPSFTDLLNYLCKTNIYNIPKAGVAGIKLSVDRWRDITAHCGVCDLFINPKSEKEICGKN